MASCFSELDLEELGIILGIKNKRNEISKIINERQSKNLISAVYDLVENMSKDVLNNSEDIWNESEMFTDFTNGCKWTLGINVNFDGEKIENSSLLNSLKCKNGKEDNPLLQYSENYLKKLKKDFNDDDDIEMIKKNEVEMNKIKKENTRKINADIEIITPKYEGTNVASNCNGKGKKQKYSNSNYNKNYNNGGQFEEGKKKKIKRE